MIVSIDGSGNVELHHPASETGAASLTRGTEQPLPKGYKLDAAPRFERFFFITSKTPGSLDVLQVVAAARSLAAKPDADRSALAVSSALEVSSLTLRKGPMRCAWLAACGCDAVLSSRRSLGAVAIGHRTAALHVACCEHRRRTWASAAAYPSKDTESLQRVLF